MSGLAAGAAAYLGGAAQGKQQREEDQAARDERDAERAERHGEFEQEYGLESKRTESQLLTDAQTRDIQKETQGWARELQPYVKDAQIAMTKHAQNQLTTDADNHAVAVLVQKTDQLKYDLEKKYGPKMAEVAYDQAVASLGLTNAQIQEAHAYANYYASGGAHGGGGAASKGYPDGLSPTGQAFYDTLYNTNNPPTAQQALIAINNPTNRLDQNDRRILQANVLSSRSGLPTPVSQGKLAASRAPLSGLGLDQHHQTILLGVLDKIDSAPDRGAAAAAFVEDATNGSGKGKVPQNVIDFVRQYGQDEAAGGSESRTFAPQPGPQHASLPGGGGEGGSSVLGSALGAIPGMITRIGGALRIPGARPPGVPQGATYGMFNGQPSWGDNAGHVWSTFGQQIK